jgi:hypothetical protein
VRDGGTACSGAIQRVIGVTAITGDDLETAATSRLFCELCATMLVFFSLGLLLSISQFLE